MFAKLVRRIVAQFQARRCMVVLTRYSKYQATYRTDGSGLEVRKVSQNPGIFPGVTFKGDRWDLNEAVPGRGSHFRLWSRGEVVLETSRVLALTGSFSYHV